MKLPAILFLCLSSLASSSAYADAGAIDGSWRGTYFSPSSENLIDLDCDRSTALCRGRYPGTPESGTVFPVDVARSGQPVRIVVPNVGVFEGILRGDVLEGTFRSAAGTGPFRMDRAPEPDFLFVD